jgi:hypothetical protein
MRRWRRVCLCGLLCLVTHGLAMSQTATPPPQPAPAPTAPAATAEQPASAHAAANHTSTHASSNTAAKKSKSSHKKVSAKRGQKAIDPARAREIQTALIREHYMTGQPSGTWDSATQAAMQRYQADQGWQSKTTPDARALIKLGLGPSHDHLLNPESAMTTTAVPADPKVAAKPAPAADNLPHQ